MSILDNLYIRLTAELVGEDEFGHKYYLSRKKDYLGRNNRLIIYNGYNEPSKVPPLWHAWLHHLSDKIPLRGKVSNYRWQKEHQPNLTGTKHAHSPLSSGVDGIRKKVSADFELWKPK